MNNGRGFFGVGVYQVKYGCNVGTLWRSAYQLGASFVFTIGRRYEWQHSDVLHTTRHVPLWQFLTFDEFAEHAPNGAKWIAVELGGQSLAEYQHRQQCVYVLGAEDGGLPKSILERCHEHIAIPALRTASYNVAIAGAIVMYDRMLKAGIGEMG